MRGLVTAGPCVRLERCAGLRTSVADPLDWSGWLLIARSGLLLALRFLDVLTPTVEFRGRVGSVGHHRQRPAPAGQFARDGDVGDHRSFLAQVQVDPAWCSRWLPAWPRARAAAGAGVPAALQHHAGAR